MDLDPVVPPRSHDQRMPDRDPATRSTVTVFSLSVNAYVGAAPMTHNVASRHEIKVPRVRSHVGMTTRNRDHASHAQNSSVRRGVPSGPGTIGP